MKTVTLATGQVTAADALTVELHRPATEPAFVLVRWPGAPTVLKTDPRALAALAASVVRLLADAQTRLAAIQAGKP